MKTILSNPCDITVFCITARFIDLLRFIVSGSGPSKDDFSKGTFSSPSKQNITTHTQSKNVFQHMIDVLSNQLIFLISLCWILILIFRTVIL